jgi:hypothetical protein
MKWAENAEFGMARSKLDGSNLSSMEALSRWLHFGWLLEHEMG